MRRQQGQSAVEFALMAPIVFMMIFGMIWGGIMFMEYMHYSNAVRTAARVIAVADADKRAQRITEQYDFLNKAYEEEITVKFYKPNVNISYYPSESEPVDVVVEVAFYMEDSTYNSLPNILKWMDFPPRSIKTLNYHMRIESSSNSSSSSS